MNHALKRLKSLVYGRLSFQSLTLFQQLFTRWQTYVVHFSEQRFIVENILNNELFHFFQFIKSKKDLKVTDIAVHY